MIPPFGAWVGPRNAQIVLVGEAWGREEAETGGVPFAGAAGKELWRLLGEAWSDHEPEEHRRVASYHRYGNSWINERGGWLASAGIALTNVLNFRPPENKIAALCATRSAILDPTYKWPPLAGMGKYLRPEYLPEITRLHEELASCRPNVVVALGNTATWSLLRVTNISQIRGTCMAAQGEALEGVKVLPTYHPASILYEGQWSRRPIIVADLMKAQREARFPEIRRPQRAIRIDPTIEEWESACEDLIYDNRLTACDTETSLNMIDTIGFSNDRRAASVCQVGPHRVKRGSGYETIYPMRDGKKVIHYWSFEEEFRFWSATKRLLESGVPLLFQNGAYDLQYLLRLGMRPANCAEDTMLFHHALYPEMQKGLGFLGSIYTGEPAWKLMRREADTTKRDD